MFWKCWENFGQHLVNTCWLNPHWIFWISKKRSFLLYFQDFPKKDFSFLYCFRVEKWIITKVWKCICITRNDSKRFKYIVISLRLWRETLINSKNVLLSPVDNTKVKKTLSYIQESYTFITQCFTVILFMQGNSKGKLIIVKRAAMLLIPNGRKEYVKDLQCTKRGVLQLVEKRSHCIASWEGAVKQFKGELVNPFDRNKLISLKNLLKCFALSKLKWTLDMSPHMALDVPRSVIKD